MNSKISFCTCTTPSCVLLKTKTFDAALTQNLFKAQQKLIPVINTVIGISEGNSKELHRSYYLSLQQYEDVVWAQKILKQFNQTHMHTSKDILFDLEQRSIKTNKLGQVYIDTPVLLQLIELHKMLGHIIQAVNQKSIDNVTSSIQTKLITNTPIGEQCSQDGSLQRPPQIDDSELLEFQNEHLPLRMNTYSGQKQTDFIVMYSSEKKGKKQKKETGEEKVSTEVTDVDGARQIIIQCLSDLNKVKTFLERDHVDASTASESKSENRATLSPNVKSGSKKNSKDQEQKDLTRDPECCEVDFDTDKMSDSSRIVICIRDKDECQGAVEVIIKQCSWCKELEEKVDADGIKDVPTQTQTVPENLDVVQPSVEDVYLITPRNEINTTGSDTQPTEDSKNISINVQELTDESDIQKSRSITSAKSGSSSRLFELDSSKTDKTVAGVEFGNTTTYTSEDIIPVEQSTENTKGQTDRGKITEVHIIHGCQDTCTCSTSTDSEKLNSNINVIFNPEDPVNSVVEPPEVTPRKYSSKLSQAEFPSESAQDAEDLVATDALPPITESPRRRSRRSSSSLKLPQAEFSPELARDAEDLVATDALPPITESPRRRSRRSSSSLKLSQAEFSPESAQEADDFGDTDALPPITDSPRRRSRRSSSSLKLSPAEFPSESGPDAADVVATDALPPITESPKRRSRRSNEKLLEHSSTCSRIKLCETANLCFSTPDGEELIVSLTIRPNDKNKSNVQPSVQPKLSLKDIFSESKDALNEDLNRVESFDATVVTEQQHQVSYEENYAQEEDLVLEVKSADMKEMSEEIIPLPRTRICSSLEFDVTVVDTRLKTTGIKHFNPNVVVKLREFGVDNILRACRPAKCCRKAVLNEKLRKCLPYPPSLKSLPLDEGDVETIKESWEMSLKNENEREQRNKVQQYAAFVKHYPKIKFPFTIQNDKYIYHCSITRQMQSQARIFKDYLLKKKLYYYINLVHGVDRYYPPQQYKIYYFEANSYNAANILLRRPLPTNPVPTRTGRNIVNQSSSHLHKTVSASKRNNNKRDDAKKRSKIPIYKFKDNSKQSPKHSDAVLYNLSCSSLSTPDNEQMFKRLIETKPKDLDSMRVNIEKLYKDGSKQQLLHILNANVFKQSDSSDGDLFDKHINVHSGSSKLSNQSLNVYRKGSRILACKPRRKKQEFYLTRSKSEISVRTTRTLVHFSGGDKKLSSKYVGVNSKSSLVKTPSNELPKEHTSENNLKLCLDYFVDLFFNYMVKEIANEVKTKQDVLTKSEGIHHILKPKSMNYLNTSEKQIFKEESTGQDKTKSSVFVETVTTKSINRHKSFQTNIMQFEQKTMSLQTVATNIEDKGVQCPAEIFLPENEEESFLSRLDSRLDLLYGCMPWSRIGLTGNLSENDESDDNMSDRQEECISKSILKIQEYDEYMRSKWQFSPIDYFVYQNCMKSAGSVMNKIMNKSKNIFNFTPCKCPGEDVKVKYKNAKGMENSSSKRDCKICDKCNCYLELCNDETHSDLTKYCRCPTTNKASKSPKPKISKLKREKQCGHWLSVSFLKNAPRKSLNYIGKSVSSIFKSKDKSQKASLCACTKPKKDRQVAVCFNPDVQDFAVCVNLPRAANCKCKRCQSFNEVGCCKCSHCMNELDKSVGTKVSKNEIGILCNCFKDGSKGETEENLTSEKIGKSDVDTSNKDCSDIEKQSDVDTSAKDCSDIVGEVMDEIVSKSSNPSFTGEPKKKSDTKNVKIKDEPNFSDESFEEKIDYDDDRTHTYYFTLSQQTFFRRYNRLDLDNFENAIWAFRKMNFCSDQTKELRILDITENLRE